MSFGQLISEYFDSLKLDEYGGLHLDCRLSKKKFYIRPVDVEFYQKIKVPLPSLCPDERMRRKAAFYGTQLFYNVSDFTNKQIVSMYPPNSKYQVYEPDVWFSDKWDPLDYGIDIDMGMQLRASTNNFMQKFRKLQMAVPRLALFSDNSNVNSDYTNNSMRLLDCYMTFNSADSRDLYYVHIGVNSENCYGGFIIFNSQWCYECRETFDCYECFWCDDVKNCRESYFLTDCRGCANCFMCSGLRHKQYCWENEQLSREEYEKRLQKIDFGSWEQLGKLLIRNYELRMDYVGACCCVPGDLSFKNHNENSENVVKSDYIINSKNVYQSFYILDSENIAYCEGFMGYRDTYDCGGGLGGELCYESMMVSSESNYNVKFCLNVSNSRNMEYCDTCSNCQDCFGCVGLRNKQYCILNRQYTKREYEEFVDKIKVNMLEVDEYGEFFSPDLSCFPYNISEAFLAGPDKGNLENAQKYGYKIAEVGENLLDITGTELNNQDIPDNIRDIDEDILELIIYDQENNKKFKYISQDLYWHKKYNIALPRAYPLNRIWKARDYFERGFWWPNS